MALHTGFGANITDSLQTAEEKEGMLAKGPCQRGFCLRQFHHNPGGLEWTMDVEDPHALGLRTTFLSLAAPF